jgi:hypothetical protein
VRHLNRAHPFKVHCGFDPDAVIGPAPEQSLWVSKRDLADWKLGKRRLGQNQGPHYPSQTLLTSKRFGKRFKAAKQVRLAAWISMHFDPSCGLLLRICRKLKSPGRKLSEIEGT